MIVENKSTPIFGNIQEVQTFGVKSNNKAYQILSDSLYTYKIRAFIRELSCNAVDGHKELFRQTGSAPKYFDVEPPTILSMQWRIRDYGIGLDERGMQIFSTYFESTKELNEDDIGGFGLGSKSPFAYTKSLSISSYHEGIKRVYSVFVQDGIPKLTKIFEEPSTEPSGVEIIVPIKENDIHNVYDEMHYVYSTFDSDGYYPNVMDDNFKICDYKTNLNAAVDHFHSGMYAICGGVSYPIPREYYKDTLLHKISSYTTFIDFDISSVDPAPSREQLQMNDKTVEAIKNKFIELDNYILAEVDSIFESHKDDIFTMYIKINDISGTGKLNLQGCYSNQSYTGRTIWEHVSNQKKYMIDNKTLKDYEVEYGSFNGQYAKAYMEYTNKFSKKNKHFCKLRTLMYTEKTKITKKKSYWDNDLVYDTSSMTLGLQYYDVEKHFVFMNFDDNKHIRKLKTLVAIGVIPACNRDMFAFNTGTDYHDAGITEARFKLMFGDDVKFRNVSVKEVLEGLAKEFSSKCRTVHTYNVDELFELHKDAIEEYKNKLAEQNKKDRLASDAPLIDRKGIPNAMQYRYGYSVKDFRTSSAEVAKLKGYYMVTKDGKYFDGDLDGNWKYFDAYPMDIMMFLKHFASSQDEIVYQFQAPLSKAAARNENLIRITFDDIKRMFDVLKNEYIKEENIEVIYNTNSYYIPEECESIVNYFDALRQDGNHKEEISYVQQKSGLFNEHIQISEAINSLKQTINEKFSAKIESFNKLNPLIAPLIGGDYELEDYTIKAINDNVIIPKS